MQKGERAATCIYSMRCITIGVTMIMMPVVGMDMVIWLLFGADKERCVCLALTYTVAITQSVPSPIDTHTNEAA